MSEYLRVQAAARIAAEAHALPRKRKVNGRRAQRAELERTWTVYEPRKPGTPFRKGDFEKAEDRT